MSANLKRPIAAALTAALATAALAAPTTGLANPNVSEWTHDFDYDQDACVGRAKAAFANEGWVHIEVQSKYVILADKDKLSGIVVCLYESDTQATVAVFVAGGPDGLADSESGRLKTELK